MKNHPLTTVIASLCLLLVSLASLNAENELPPLAKPGEGGILSAELIYTEEEKLTPQCHASTIVETPSGMVAAWFGGTREKNPDVGIWVSHLEDGEWSKPVEVVDGSEGEDQEYACWNPVLFQPESGPLLLFYKVGIDPRSWWGMLITSDDGGKTWSKPRKLGTNDALPEANRNLLGPVKNKPIQLSDGTILCPSSTENEGWKVHFEVTRDNGETWEVIGPIHDASKFNAIQPSILRYEDGRMQVLCRSQEETVAQSWSKDGGKTWGPVTATSLPNPNSGTDAVTLADGRQLLVYNHTAKRGPFPSNRNMLNVALSDDGEQWRPILTLEKAEKSEYSYPAVIQASDGKVHITYTWKRRSVKHVVVDPTQLP
ncbi:MAG: sialidase family protein [Verrucomicrobiota bacterium]